MRKLNRRVEAARQAMAIGSLESDLVRDIADWQAMRRVVTVYMPLLALAPVLAGVLFFIG
jgi:hypothetical protein